MALFRSIATVGGWTMVSRVLGFARDMLIANVIGAGLIADAFFVAFKFPNFFRRLFAEGAFNAAFVPLFAGRLTTDGKEAAVKFAAEVASVLGTVLLVFTLAAMLTMPWLMLGIAPGFTDQPDKFALTVDLTRLTFPYLTFMALVALMGGMLNSLQRFAATAAAPIVLNVVLIAVLLGVRHGVLPDPGHALAWGVAAAGLAQFVWIALACKRAGIGFVPPRPRLTPGVKRLLVLMAPALLGAGVVQVNVVIDVILASTLSEGSVSFLYYADRVNQLPLGVVGVAVGITLLPLLTRQLRSGDAAAALGSQNRAIEFALTLTLPAAAALIAIPGPIVTVLFQRGAFDTASAEATAGALAAFAVGLPAYVLIKALTPGFFAREDTKTPVKVAVVAMIANVVLAVALMQVLAHVGIALATALSAWFNATALAVLLVRRGHLAFDARLRRCVPRLILASALMGVAVWWGADWLAGPLGSGEAQRIVALASLVVAGGGLFALAALGTGAVRMTDLRAAVSRRASP
ncbi:MAG: murein biosynthesis integral membrane protein MurJ [Rhodospirillaceae bacterium]|nr:murein biosynthesis integral membrane protein MurJ [Rhodospirillaceae bacterium]